MPPGNFLEDQGMSTLYSWPGKQGSDSCQGQGTEKPSEELGADQGLACSTGKGHTLGSGCPWAPHL